MQKNDRQVFKKKIFLETVVIISHYAHHIPLHVKLVFSQCIAFQLVLFIFLNCCHLPHRPSITIPAPVMYLISLHFIGFSPSVDNLEMCSVSGPFDEHYFCMFVTFSQPNCTGTSAERIPLFSRSL